VDVRQSPVPHGISLSEPLLHAAWHQPHVCRGASSQGIAFSGFLNRPFSMMWFVMLADAGGWKVQLPAAAPTQPGMAKRGLSARPGSARRTHARVPLSARQVDPVPESEINMLGLQTTDLHMHIITREA
jgi:hypothetical protein